MSTHPGAGVLAMTSGLYLRRQCKATEAGADPNGADFAKPLCWARHYEHDETAALLTKAGAHE
ncbi:MAG: hypothetical protein ACE361_10115 [Aureliella sp.]